MYRVLSSEAPEYISKTVQPTPLLRSRVSDRHTATQIRRRVAQPRTTTDEWKHPTDPTTDQQPQPFCRQHRQNFSPERGVCTRTIIIRSDANVVGHEARHVPKVWHPQWTSRFLEWLRVWSAKWSDSVGAGGRRNEEWVTNNWRRRTVNLQTDWEKWKRR